MRLRRLGATAAVVIGLAVPGAGLVAPATGEQLVGDGPPASTTPYIVDGQVRSIARIGDTMYAGGTFSTVRNPGSSTDITRNGLVAFDADTGKVRTGFDARIDSDATRRWVDTVIPSADGSSVLVGGKFLHLGGRQRPYLGSVSASTGALRTGFDPGRVDGRVMDLKLVRGRLWVAGSFDVIHGRTQQALATLDPATGAYSPYARLNVSGTHNGGITSVLKLAWSPQVRTVALIGNFSHVGGLPRQQIALAVPTPDGARVSSWRTRFFEGTCGPRYQTYLRDVDFSPAGRFFVVVTSGASHGRSSPCDSATRWETGTKRANSFSWHESTGADTLLSVEVTGAAVYVGGHQRWLNNPFRKDQAGEGAVARQGIAALWSDNGLPFTWNPGHERGMGVAALRRDDDGLWIGSDTRLTAGYDRGRLSLLPAAGGTSIPAQSRPASLTSAYLASETGDPTTEVVRRTRTSTGFTSQPVVASGDEDWSVVTGSFELDGRVYTTRSDGSFVRQTFDGTNLGGPSPVDGSDQVVPLQRWHDDAQHIGALFYARGRIYYTFPGDGTLYYRYFNAQSGVVGAVRREADRRTRSGLAYGDVRGAFVAGRYLYWSNGSGALRRARWSPGTAAGRPVSGTFTTVSGPSEDGLDWRSTALWARDPS